MKIDHRINYKIVLDTETCPLDKDYPKVIPENMFTYDIGWAIVDKKGNVYRTKSYIVNDIFFQEADLMQSAYYSKKIPQYLNDIANGERVVKTFYQIRTDLIQDMREYNVNEIYAHNMRFDLGTLNTTQRWLTKSKYRYFFPYNCQICDTLKMARDVIAKQPTYKRFCQENGFMTKNNQVKLTAEVLYKYITQNLDFAESHTALEDVLIEKEILAYCYKQHKKMRRLLYDKVDE